MLAIAGTGYGLIGILVIILLVVMIFYFIRRARLPRRVRERKTSNCWHLENE
jgi:uncharacterized membrane protein